MGKRLRKCGICHSAVFLRSRWDEVRKNELKSAASRRNIALASADSIWQQMLAAEKLNNELLQTQVRLEHEMFNDFVNRAMDEQRCKNSNTKYIISAFRPVADGWVDDRCLARLQICAFGFVALADIWAAPLEWRKVGRKNMVQALKGKRR